MAGRGVGPDDDTAPIPVITPDMPEACTGGRRIGGTGSEPRSSRSSASR